MKRRKFLKGILYTGATIVVAPAILSHSLPVQPEWIINPITKTISYNGVQNGTVITMQQLYQFCADEWKNNEKLMNIDFPFEKKIKKSLAV